MKEDIWKRTCCMLSSVLAVLILTACGNQSQTVESVSSEEVHFEKADFTEPVSKKVEKAEQIVLKAGGIQPTDDLSTQALYRMADSISVLSGGTLSMEVFPDGSLGDAETQIEDMELGKQDIFVDANWMGTMMKEKVIDTMWFVFEDQDSYQAYIESDLNRAYEEQFCKEQNIRIVTSNWYRAPRSFVSKKALNSPKDFAGLRIRVPALNGYYASVDAIGGNPKQIEWNQTRLALGENIVDAAEGPVDALYTMGFYKEAPYVTVSNHLRDSMQVMINNDVYEKMTEDQQEALRLAAEDAGKWYSRRVEETVKQMIEKMEADGAHVEVMDSDTYSELQSRCIRRVELMDAEGMYWPVGTYRKMKELY